MEQKDKSRIVIFCLTIGERQQLKWFLEAYVKEHLPKYNSQIELQEFDNFYRPKGNIGIGHLDERELLYIIDRHAPSDDLLMTSEQIDAARKLDWKRVALEESLKLINEKQIPYIFYQGEYAGIRNRMKVMPLERERFVSSLTRKMDSILEKMKDRLRLSDLLDLK